MSAAIDVLDPAKPKRVLIVASNPSVSEQTGWPIGFWWSQLTHAYWELSRHGYRIDIASPDGGPPEADSWSDPRDKSAYSAEDPISLGFVTSPEPAKLVQASKPLADVAVDVGDYDAALFVGGPGPMYTVWNDERVHALAWRSTRPAR